MLEALLGLFLYLALGPVGVLLADTLLGPVAIDVLGALIADPLGPPVLPVDDGQAPKVLVGDQLCSGACGALGLRHTVLE
ncbi:hypothetical protein NHX12_002685 [Muraenolepis orangiensis]|uniref:Uncharacterized protein n=1 Tax=Muraenolepis orangiensis TaxID=630683 RepID=A0A9Q0IGL9_9TELE|nr:hypothetical protein NHX12_002685 [Muraenolepis orangiensis]